MKARMFRRSIVVSVDFITVISAVDVAKLGFLVDVDALIGRQARPANDPPTRSRGGAPALSFA
jgi:hypothetical protein